MEKLRKVLLPVAYVAGYTLAVPIALLGGVAEVGSHLKVYHTQFWN